MVGDDGILDDDGWRYVAGAKGIARKNTNRLIHPRTERGDRCLGTHLRLNSPTPSPSRQTRGCSVQRSSLSLAAPGPDSSGLPTGVTADLRAVSRGALGSWRLQMTRRGTDQRDSNQPTEHGVGGCAMDVGGRAMRAVMSCRKGGGRRVRIFTKGRSRGRVTRSTSTIRSVEIQNCWYRESVQCSCRRSERYLSSVATVSTWV